jgi:hypothetical protein
VIAVLSIRNIISNNFKCYELLRHGANVKRLFLNIFLDTELKSNFENKNNNIVHNFQQCEIKNQSIKYDIFKVNKGSNVKNIQPNRSNFKRLSLKY